MLHCKSIVFACKSGLRRVDLPLPLPAALDSTFTRHDGAARHGGGGADGAPALGQPHTQRSLLHVHGPATHARAGSARSAASGQRRGRRRRLAAPLRAAKPATIYTPLGGARLHLLAQRWHWTSRRPTVSLRLTSHAAAASRRRVSGGAAEVASSTGSESTATTSGRHAAQPTTPGGGGARERRWCQRPWWWGAASR